MTGEITLSPCPMGESLHRVLTMGREAARAQDVAWLRECENEIPVDHIQGRAALHNATDGIEQGWAFLAATAGRES